MNLDDFLDNVDLEEGDSDTIIIDLPDEVEEVPKSEIKLDPIISIDVDETPKIAEVSDYSKPTSVFGIVSQVNAAIKNEDLSMALSFYSDLELAQSKLSSEDELLKLELSKLMIQLNDRILKLKHKNEVIFKKLLLNIKTNLELGNSFISSENFSSSKSILINLVDDFKKLPDGFMHQSDQVKFSISKFKLDLQKVQQKLLAESNAKLRSDLDDLLIKSDSAFSSGDISKARDLLGKVRILYDSIDDNSKSQFDDVKTKLLKKLSSIELVIQIKNLRDELGSDLKIFPSAASISNIKVKSKSKINASSISAVKSLSKLDILAPISSHIPSRKSVRRHTKYISKAPLNRLDILSSSLVVPRAISSSKFIASETLINPVSDTNTSCNLINSSLKKAKLNKVKLAIIKHDINLAHKLLIGLDEEFPGDDDILKQISDLETNDEFVNSNVGVADLEQGELVDQKLNLIESELKEGKLDLVKKDLGEIVNSKDGSFEVEEVSGELSDELKAIDSSSSFDVLKDKLDKAKTDLDSKLINRRLTLAKHQIKKQDFERAKANIEMVLRREPGNRVAKKLLNLIH